MKNKFLKGLVASFALTVSCFANSALISLEGLGLETTWTDSEGVTGDMPLDVWGLSQSLQATEVGIWVQFANGLTSWATYSGIESHEWGTCCSVTAVEESSFGWLAGATLHGIGRADLPMAWVSASNPWTGNFDLDYDSPFGSDWRASTSGWGSVEIALYSNVRAVSEVPEPSTVAIFALGLMGLASRKFKKQA